MFLIQTVSSITHTETTGRYYAIAARFTPTAFLAARVRRSGDESQPVVLVVGHGSRTYNQSINLRIDFTELLHKMYEFRIQHMVGVWAVLTRLACSITLRSPHRPPQPVQVLSNSITILIIRLFPSSKTSKTSQTPNQKITNYCATGRQSPLWGA